MRVYEYKDYDDYVAAQTETNKAKVDWVYVVRRIIKRICEYKTMPGFIICHGTRSGAEQAYFKEIYEHAYVIGTEISETAVGIKDTVHHDFTIPKKEWIGKADIVYSNSFDHTIDPVKTMATWRDQLNPNGRLFIEYAEEQSRGHYEDPLEATNREINDLIKSSGMIVEDIWYNSLKHGGIMFVARLAK